MSRRLLVPKALTIAVLLLLMAPYMTATLIGFFKDIFDIITQISTTSIG